MHRRILDAMKIIKKSSRPKNNACLLAILVMSSGLACTETNFGSSNANTAKTKKTEAEPAAKTKPSSNSKKGAHATPSKEQKPLGNIDDTGTRCLSKPVDVRLVFLLDVTSSMDPAIQLVKNNVSTVAQNLQGLRFRSDAVKVASVEVGLVAYGDYAYEESTIAIGHADRISSALATIPGVNGYDPWEGGLQAMMTGLSMLESSPKDSTHDFLPIVVAITDTFSHNGLGDDPVYSVRDCSVGWSPLSQALASPTFDKMLVYDASQADNGAAFIPDPSIAPCAPYDSTVWPSQQWEDVRAEWQRASSNRAKATSLGRGFGFPFTADSLLTVLPQDIQASFTVCEE